MARPLEERGQASVELIAAVPVLLLVTLLVAQLALAGYALWSAGVAARAGARADYVGGDAEAAARSALPLVLRSRSPTAPRRPVRWRWPPAVRQPPPSTRRSPVGHVTEWTWRWRAGNSRSASARRRHSGRCHSASR